MTSFRLSPVYRASFLRGPRLAVFFLGTGAVVACSFAGEEAASSSSAYNTASGCDGGTDGSTPPDGPACAIPPALPLTVARFSFESTTADDYGNWGDTTAGSPSYVSGRVGKSAAWFAGQTNPAVLQLDPNRGRMKTLRFGDSFTIDVWVKAPPQPDPAGAVVAEYYACGGQCPSTATSLYRLAIVNGAPQLAIRGGYAATGTRAEVLDAGTKIDDDRWHHVSAMRHLGGWMSIYVDGKLAASSPLSPSALTPFAKDDPTEIDVVTVGAGRVAGVVGAHQRYFRGALDELTLYNRALSPEEIAAKAVECVPPPAPQDELVMDICGPFGPLPSANDLAVTEDGRAYALNGSTITMRKLVAASKSCSLEATGTQQVLARPAQSILADGAGRVWGVNVAAKTLDVIATNQGPLPTPYACATSSSMTVPTAFWSGSSGERLLTPANTLHALLLAPNGCTSSLLASSVLPLPPPQAKMVPSAFNGTRALALLTPEVANAPPPFMVFYDIATQSTVWTGGRRSPLPTAKDASVAFAKAAEDSLWAIDGDGSILRIANDGKVQRASHPTILPPGVTEVSTVAIAPMPKGGGVGYALVQLKGVNDLLLLAHVHPR